jgi:hypothetical protein
VLVTLVSTATLLLARLIFTLPVFASLLLTALPVLGALLLAALMFARFVARLLILFFIFVHLASPCWSFSVRVCLTAMAEDWFRWSRSSRDKQ